MRGLEAESRRRDGRTDSAGREGGGAESGGAPAAGTGVQGAARPWPGPRSGCRAPPPGAGAEAGTRPAAPQPNLRAETVWTEGFGGPVAPGNYWGAPAGPREGVTEALPSRAACPEGSPEADFLRRQGSRPRSDRRARCALIWHLSPGNLTGVRGGAGSPPALPSSPPSRENEVHLLPSRLPGLPSGFDRPPSSSLRHQREGPE